MIALQNEREQRREPDAAEAVQDRRQGPSWESCCRCSRLSGCGRRGGADPARRAARRRRLPARLRRPRRRRPARLRARRRAPVAEAITAIWSGRVESDTLNALVSAPGSTSTRWPSCAPTAATAGDRRRLHRALPERRVRRPSAAWPRARRAVRARSTSRRRAGRGGAGGGAIVDDLAAVGSLDEDRILRASSRSWPPCARTRALGRAYLSFKLRSADVPHMPKPAPLFEIFVYHPPSRASTCAAATSRAAASAGRTAARTTAPRCSA